MPLVALATGPSAVLTELVSSFAGTIAVVTAAVAGFARAWAVLRRFPHEQTEWMTAAGFVGGAIVTLFLVCIDSILKLH
jgi:hypothetical protein